MAEKCQRKFDYSDLIERYQKDQRFQGQMIRNGYNEENMRQFEQWKYEKENKIKQSPFFHQRTAAERSHGKRQFQVTRPPASEIGLEPHKTVPRVACDDYHEMRAMADRMTKESQQLGRSLTTEEMHDLAVGHDFQVSYTDSRPSNTVRLRSNQNHFIRLTSPHEQEMLQLQDVEDALHFKQRAQEEKEVQQHQLEDEALTKEEEEALRIAHAIEGMIGPEEEALRQQQERDERRIEAVWGSWRDTDDWQWHDASLQEEYEKPIDYWTEAEWWQQHAWKDDHAGRNAWPSRSNYQQQQPQQQQQPRQHRQQQQHVQQAASWWPDWAPWWQHGRY